MNPIGSCPSFIQTKKKGVNYLGIFKKGFATMLSAIIVLLMATQVAMADQDGNYTSIFVESVNYYDQWNANNDHQLTATLNTPDEAVYGLYDIVSDPNTNWQWAHWYENQMVWQTDWTPVGDSQNADDNDLVAYCGHGYPPNNFALNTNLNSWNVWTGDVDWGDRDVEWVLTFTCNFLNGDPVDKYGWVGNGVHLVCGYKTNMTVTANAGSTFAQYAKAGYTVKTAWELYGDDTQPYITYDGFNYTRVFGATASANDHLWGYGSVSADPPIWNLNKSLYSYWDHQA